MNLEHYISFISSVHAVIVSRKCETFS